MSKEILKAAGVLTLIVAFLQVVLTCVPSWSTQYFSFWKGVVEKTPLFFYLAGFAAASIFVVFGLYALSGAGSIRPLPYLRTGLIIISTLFILRGLFIFLWILINSGVIKSGAMIPEREFYFSGISLVIGLLYIIGTIFSWAQLPVQQKHYTNEAK